MQQAASTRVVRSSNLRPWSDRPGGSYEPAESEQASTFLDPTSAGGG